MSYGVLIVTFVWHFAFLLLLGPKMVMGLTSACDCSPSVTGAIFGTLIITLLLVFVVIVIAWFCCLRKRWLQRTLEDRNIIRTHTITDADLAQVSIDEPQKTDVAIEAAALGLEEKHQVWGLPIALRKYMEMCEIPHEIVYPVKLENSPRDLDFSVAQHGVGTFVKRKNAKSTLHHIRQMDEGMHIVGMSIAFSEMDSEIAARFIALAAPFKPHLYLRKQPLFDVDDLEGFPVQKEEASALNLHLPFKDVKLESSSRPSVDEVDLQPPSHDALSSDTEPELVVVEEARLAHAAPLMRVGSMEDSVAVSDDDPSLYNPALSSWTFERSCEDQPERFISVHRPPPPPPKSVSDDSSTSWAAELSGRGPNGDVYRATPISLSDEGQFDLNVDSPGDFAHVDGMDLQPKASSVLSQPSLLLEGRTDAPRDGGSLDSLAIDSGLGSSANIGINGLLSSPDASQDGHNGAMLMGAISVESPVDPKLTVNAVETVELADVSSPSISRSSSSRSSVTEVPIESTANTRRGANLPSTGLEHLQELSELDRKIALNNIEIATLMLNDSHDRQFFAARRTRYSESEGEEAQEEPILATSKEELKRSRFPRQNAAVATNSTDVMIMDKSSHEDLSNASDLYESDLDEVDDSELSNVIKRLAESSDSDSTYKVKVAADLDYEPDEAYA